jgi:two-component system, OmpR family, phosphate regulon response regulator PhoB
MKEKVNNKNRKTILIVEDNESLRKIIQLKLKEAHYDAVLAKDAEEAFKNLEDSLPDIVWLDIYLPGMNGLDFLNKLRTDSKTKNLKVVVVSVSGSDKKKAVAEKLGVSDYLVKSNYKIEEIVERISAILKS